MTQRQSKICVDGPTREPETKAVYYPLSKLIEPHVDKPLSKLPKPVHARVKAAKWVHDHWDARPDQRMQQAIDYDYQHDPALEPVRQYWFDLCGEIHRTEVVIREWDLLNPQSITEKKIKTDTLTALAVRMRALHALNDMPPLTVITSDWTAIADDVLAAAVAKRAENDTPEGNSEITGSDHNNATPPKQRRQESRIVDLLVQQGYKPLDLPARNPGKPGVKAAIRKLALLQPKLFSKKSFEYAWQRLRDGDELHGGE